jgi:hypothetical protein
MPRDPLDALARLRRLETAEARRRLATQTVQEAAATERRATADAALRAEHAVGDAAWRLWLPRGLAERDRAALARSQALTRLREAQAGLAACRAAERATEVLQERRAAEMRRLALRRDQGLLDEVAGRARLAD